MQAGRFCPEVTQTTFITNNEECWHLLEQDSLRIIIHLHRHYQPNTQYYSFTQTLST